MGNCFTQNNNSQEINYDDEFWEYYGINIPTSILVVPSIDRVNYVTKNGSETLMAPADGKWHCYTIKEYEKKFAVVGSDGKLYWKKDLNLWNGYA
jgi:hypothetical protein